jgi:hypothetical protein
MSKKSILGLEKSLCDLGYNPNHINLFIGTVDQLLQRGYAEVQRHESLNTVVKRNSERPFTVISAAGVRPLFKINAKSVDVYLLTTGELNVLRIHHPSNSWAFHEQSESGCYCGNQKWLATKIGDVKRGPDKGFSF